MWLPIMFLDFYAASHGIVVLVTCLCLEDYLHANYEKCIRFYDITTKRSCDTILQHIIESDRIWARISKCVPTHIFLRTNLNYRNYIKFLIYWKPIHCSIWI